MLTVLIHALDGTTKNWAVSPSSAVPVTYSFFIYYYFARDWKECMCHFIKYILYNIIKLYWVKHFTATKSCRCLIIFSIIPLLHYVASDGVYSIVDALRAPPLLTQVLHRDSGIVTGLLTMLMHALDGTSKNWAVHPHGPSQLLTFFFLYYYFARDWQESSPTLLDDPVFAGSIQCMH